VYIVDVPRGKGDKTMHKIIGNYMMQVTEHHGEWMARVVYLNGGSAGGSVCFMKRYETMSNAIKAADREIKKYV
jgi:hypothetical protein